VASLYLSFWSVVCFVRFLSNELPPPARLFYYAFWALALHCLGFCFYGTFYPPSISISYTPFRDLYDLCLHSPEFSFFSLSLVSPKFFHLTYPLCQYRSRSSKKYLFSSGIHYKRALCASDPQPPPFFLPRPPFHDISYSFLFPTVRLYRATPPPFVISFFTVASHNAIIL